MQTTRLAILARAFAVWLILICAEILHGFARGILLVPHVGEFRSNQIGVFTGSVIILIIALAFVRWLGATRTTAAEGFCRISRGSRLIPDFVPAVVVPCQSLLPSKA
jgi:hypothetical protein